MTRTIAVPMLTILSILPAASAVRNQSLSHDCLDAKITERINVKTPMPSGTYACEFGMVDLLCGGCAGGKLITEPQFCYPPAAKAARLSGLVKMKMVVDRHGKVVWAEAQNDAPLLLRAAATQMALQQRYQPFVCSGRRVKAVVYLTYKFAS